MASSATTDDAGERPVLDQTVGALQFLLAFYVPGQTALDTEAWKVACAGAVAAYNRGALELGWAFEPLEADNGVVRRSGKAKRAQVPA